jgi:K+ transporter
LDKLILSSTDTGPFCLFSGNKNIEYTMIRVIYGILSIVMILGLISSSFVLTVNADKDEIRSPRKQMASGVDAKNVKCKPGLVLMTRSTNGSAVCVKSVTSTKLSKAGWGVIIDLNMAAKPLVEPVKQLKIEEKKMGDNVIEVKIKDGVGSKDR